MLQIVNYAFSNPTNSVLMWFVLLISFSLLLVIPTIVLHIRKFKGLIIAFSIATIPLLLGVIACLWSLLMTNSAQSFIQESQREAAYKVGVKMSLASIWVAASITILLVSLVLGSYLLAIRLQDRRNKHSSRIFRITLPLFRILNNIHRIIYSSRIRRKIKRYIIIGIMLLIGVPMVIHRSVYLYHSDRIPFTQVLYNNDLKISKFLTDIEPELISHGQEELLNNFKYKLAEHRSRYLYSGKNYIAVHFYIIHFLYLLIGIFYILLSILYFKFEKATTVRNVINIFSIFCLLIFIIGWFLPIFFAYPIWSIESEISNNLPNYITKDFSMVIPSLRDTFFDLSRILGLLLYLFAIGFILILMNRGTNEQEHNEAAATVAPQEGVKD